MFMSKINIVPIFNQSSLNIWYDFLRIRVSAMKYVYNYKISNEEKELVLKEFKSYWLHRAFNFAFGAYNKSDMIGFVKGYIEHGLVNIEHVYILPKYMSRGIGSQLLKKVEEATSLCADDIELVSFAKAQNFYEKNGYRLLFMNRYNKTIKKDIRSTTLPIFRITSSIKNIFKKMYKDFDFVRINKQHNPVFVYLDSDSRIQAFLVIEYCVETRSFKIYDLKFSPGFSFAKERLLTVF